MLTSMTRFGRHILMQYSEWQCASHTWRLLMKANWWWTPMEVQSQWNTANLTQCRKGGGSLPSLKYMWATGMSCFMPHPILFFAPTEPILITPQYMHSVVFTSAIPDAFLLNRCLIPKDLKTICKTMQWSKDCKMLSWHTDSDMIFCILGYIF